MGVAADGPAELGADQGQGVPLVVALLVEGGCPEVVLRGSEDPLYPPGVVEDVLQEICLPLIVQDGGVYFKGGFLLLDLLLAGKSAVDPFLQLDHLSQELLEGLMVGFKQGLEELFFRPLLFLKAVPKLPGVFPLEARYILLLVDLVDDPDVLFLQLAKTILFSEGFSQFIDELALDFIGADNEISLLFCPFLQLSSYTLQSN